MFRWMSLFCCCCLMYGIRKKEGLASCLGCCVFFYGCAQICFYYLLQTRFFGISIVFFFFERELMDESSANVVRV